jgi:hypothetical protein
VRSESRNRTAGLVAPAALKAYVRLTSRSLSVVALRLGVGTGLGQAAAVDDVTCYGSCRKRNSRRRVRHVIAHGLGKPKRTEWQPSPRVTGDMFIGWLMVALHTNQVGRSSRSVCSAPGALER